MFRRLWVRFLASLHLSKSAVCEASATKGECDYHDYCDTVEKYPDHFGLLKCERCGKEFRI